MISLISAAQTVGQMAVFGGSTYGSGNSEPNPWGLATQSAGSGAAGQMGGAGQQLIQKNMNRPNTITVQPGFSLQRDGHYRFGVSGSIQEPAVSADKNLT